MRLIFTLLFTIYLSGFGGFAQGKWEKLNDFSGSARYGASGFAIGEYGYMGLGDDGELQKDFWKYNPKNDSWTEVAPFAGTARQDAVGFSAKGKGYIGLGKNASQQFTDWWEYDPATNTWTPKTTFPGNNSKLAVYTVLKDKLYLMCGKDASNNYCKEVWVYDPANDTWQQKKDFPGDERIYAFAYAIDGKIYLGNGQNFAEGYTNMTNDLWEYEPSTDSWTETSMILDYNRTSPCYFTIGSVGYYGLSGMKDGKMYKLDPKAKIWEKTTDPFSDAETTINEAVSFVIGEKAYICTGYDSEGFTHQPQKAVYVFDPNAVEIVAPTELTASVQDYVKVKLTWKDNSSLETAQEVYYSTDAVNFEKLADLEPDVTSYTTPVLEAFKTYYFKVKVLHSSGEFAYSSWESVKISAGPYHPDDVAALQKIAKDNPDFTLRESWLKDDPTWNQVSWVQDGVNQRVVGLGIFDAKLSSLDVSTFTRLKRLTCSGNLLTSLDVSQNKNLELLNCSQNNLSSIDLSQNEKLASLSCDNNNLTSVDLSKNVDLMGFGCSRNKLTFLDVSQNKKLKNLDCRENDLSTLLIPENSNLVELICYSNDLVTLDVSNSKDLEFIRCGSNDLKVMNVSGCPNLDFLKCSGNEITSFDVSQSSKLETLDCAYNQLTSLDVSHNIELKELDCAVNKLISLDVSQNSKLEKLDCGSNELSSIDVSKNVLLKFLTCGYNKLSDLDVSKNEFLSTLFCHRNNLNKLDFSENDELRSLECSYNQLDTIFVSPDSKWEEVKCQENNLTFSTLAVFKEVTNFEYSPQNELTPRIEEVVGYKLDLAPEAVIMDSPTEFNWYEHHEIEPGIEFLEEKEPGVFHFIRGGYFQCELTNSYFPDLVLKTGIVDITDLSTGLQDVFEEELQMYPNPAMDFVTIKLPGYEVKQVLLLDGNGKTLDSYEFTDQLQMNVSHLGAGIYFLKIQSEQFSITKRLVILNR
jgi:Leucine-rich repeat (LRR) protein/N-acetylneuraminic acid mutarotase